MYRELEDGRVLLSAFSAEPNTYCIEEGTCGPTLIWSCNTKVLRLAWEYLQNPELDPSSMLTSTFENARI